VLIKHHLTTDLLLGIMQSSANQLAQCNSTQVRMHWSIF